MKILPGLSFSWRRASGLTALKQKISRYIGIPMSKQGVERKLGAAIFNLLRGKK